MAEQSVSYQHATEDVSFSAVAPTDVSADNAAAAKPDLISDVDKQAEIRHGESQLDDDYDAAEDEGLDRPKRSGPWIRIKKRWNRKGVVEVDIDHHRYDMLNCIKEGIRDAVLNHPELGPKDHLEPDHYNHILEKQVETPSGQTFHFCSYASSVFATLRRAIGLSEKEFTDSMAPESLPYLEFVSNSKSGQDFFLTNDKAYFLKTDKRKYIYIFRGLLEDYLKHFQKYPHSLIVKYLGLYSIKVSGQPEMFFYAMQSIFYPEERIEVRYDIKGCMAGRHQRPPEAGSTVITVLKDQNFVHPQEQFITLGVQDYSLLVGSHDLRPDEKTQDFGDLVLRVQKSVGTPTKKTTECSDSPSAGGGRPSGTEATATANCSGDTASQSSLSLKAAAKFKRKVTSRPFSMIDKDYLDDTDESQNRRLLPMGKNPLHIFNGPERRYFLGIIDFFTIYECRQRTGRVLKSIKFMCGDHSTIPPRPYGDRFLRFITEHVN